MMPINLLKKELAMWVEEKLQCEALIKGCHEDSVKSFRRSLDEAERRIKQYREAIKKLQS